ncbi:hypothetical protein B566_EDAN002093 [Ephemera danica]|nr:hypothetical protein B566_EDAN002093 [Ephemera danica]
MIMFECVLLPDDPPPKEALTSTPKPEDVSVPGPRHVLPPDRASVSPKDDSEDWSPRTKKSRAAESSTRILRPSPSTARQKTVFSCPHCDLLFTRRLQLNIHVKDCHRYPCLACPETFGQEIDLDSHVQRQHQPTLALDKVEAVLRRRYTCRVCEFKCKARNQMTDHMMQEHCGDSSGTESEKEEEMAANDAEETRADTPVANSSSDEFPDNDVEWPAERTEEGKKQYLGRRVIVADFICNLCTTRFKTKRALYIHSETVHKDHVFQKHVKHKSKKSGHFRCNVCLCYLMTHENMMDHTFRHRGIKPYACKYCPVRYSVRSSLAAHCHKQHGPQIRAEFILNEFEGGKKPEVDITPTYPKAPPEFMPVCKEDLLSRGRSVLVCSLCRFRVATLCKLYEHCEQAHADQWSDEISDGRSMAKPDGAFKCQACGVGFAEGRILRRHLLRHFNVKPYMCKFCGKLYQHAGSMTGHQLKQHPHWNRKNTCGFCKRAFLTRVALKSHMTKFHGIQTPTTKQFGQFWTSRDFLCSACGYNFKSKGRLHDHAIQKHPVVYPVVEEVIYNQGGPFRCRDCGITFLSDRNWILHELLHRNIKPFTCKKCKATFMYLKQIKSHAIEYHKAGTFEEEPQPSEQTFTCDYCDSPFNSLTVLMEHIEQQHIAQQSTPNPDDLSELVRATVVKASAAVQSKWLSCESCTDDSKYADEATLQMHIKFLHEEQTPVNFWYCSYCNVKFTDKTSLYSHLDQAHEFTASEAFHCGACRKKFRTTDQSIAHKIQHRDMKPLACSHCSETFSTFSLAKRHLNQHVRNARIFSCAHCDTQCSTKLQLRAHMRWHMGIQFSCRVCPETFYSRVELKRHACDMIKYHFLCAHCGLRFQHKHEIVKHRMTHPRSFECNDCGKKFKTLKSQQRHRAIYHEAPKFLCSECGTMFAFQDQLKRHLIQHKEMKYECPECPRRFWGYRLMQQHVNMEHKEKRYVCQECGRALSQKWHYVAHMRNHRGVRKYGCKECNVSYTNLNAQKYHMKTVHPERLEMNYNKLM